MSYESYEQIAAEPESVQQALLGSPDPVERVWAVWALGSRLGEGAAPLLNPMSEPHPGVRQHMVRILASLGRRRHVEVLAAMDPDAEVRTDACDYLLRTASEGQIEATLSFVSQRLFDGRDHELTVQLLPRLPPELPLIRASALNRGLRSGPKRVRAAIIFYLTSRRAQVDRARALLHRHLERETEPELITAMVEHFGADVDPALILSAVRRAPAAFDLLWSLHRTHGKLPWAVVGPLAEAPLDEPRVKLGCLHLVEDWRAPGARSWLRSVASETPEPDLPSSNEPGLSRRESERRASEADLQMWAYHTLEEMLLPTIIRRKVSAVARWIRPE